MVDNIAITLGNGKDNRADWRTCAYTSPKVRHYCGSHAPLDMRGNWGACGAPRELPSNPPVPAEYYDNLWQRRAIIKASL